MYLGRTFWKSSMATSSNPRSFYLEGRYQRTCANCGSAGDFHVHHVISKQRIKRLSAPNIPQILLYDRRNALRLCKGLDGKQCHMEYEGGKLVIETKRLKDQNICFIWEVLGPAGINYLDRNYTGVDHRFTIHEEGGCRICQP